MSSDSSLFSRIAEEMHDVEQIRQEMDVQKRKKLDAATDDLHKYAPGGTFIEPRTPTEKQLATIWAQFLGLERISVNDDFFTLGGHSIMATQILARGREVFQVEIPMEVIFAGDFTVAEMARVIEEYQIQQADPEAIAAMMRELEGLSDEEVRALLSDEDL